ncbi:hypothetical protein LSTR_LSTR016128 [Laodelphax striatellus]|uniref:Uncharacterized protein n=1 Tax=Laodelphax striatellus TaxID=195883 RepID=A0A482XUR8_LAOST|nr:hypothetical protein LSTR_LSTR016128 [Laodelphax striatellus]
MLVFVCRGYSGVRYRQQGALLCHVAYEQTGSMRVHSGYGFPMFNFGKSYRELDKAQLTKEALKTNNSPPQPSSTSSIAAARSPRLSTFAFDLPFTII